MKKATHTELDDVRYVLGQAADRTGSEACTLVPVLDFTVHWEVNQINL